MLESAAQHQHRHHQAFEALVLVGHFEPVCVHHVQRVEEGVGPRPVVRLVAVAIVFSVQDQIQFLAARQRGGGGVVQLLQQGFQFSRVVRALKGRRVAQHFLQPEIGVHRVRTARQSGEKALHFVRAHGTAAGGQGGQQVFQTQQIGVVEYGSHDGFLSLKISLAAL